MLRIHLCLRSNPEAKLFVLHRCHLTIARIASPKSFFACLWSRFSEWPWRSARIGLATKSGIQELSLTESDIEEINELYAAAELAVYELEASVPWANRP